MNSDTLMAASTIIGIYIAHAFLKHNSKPYS